MSLEATSALKFHDYLPGFLLQQITGFMFSEQSKL